MNRGALALALLLLACGSPGLPDLPERDDPPDVRVLRGRLLLHEDGELTPLPGVALRGFFGGVCRETVTDDRGIYVFEGVPFVGGGVEFVVDGYVGAMTGGSQPCRAFWIDAGETLRDLVVHPAPKPRPMGRLPDRGPGGWVRGRLLDAGDRPVAGATIEADGTGVRAESGPDGAFRLGPLPGEDQYVRVRHPDHVFAALDGVTPSEEDVEFRTLVGAEVGGVVRDADGRPLAGVTVVAFPDNRAPYDEAYPGPDDSRDRTDREGRFRIGGLPAIPLTVRVTAETGAYPIGESLREVVPGTTDLVLVARITHFETPYRLQGRVLDGSGAPVAGARVRAERVGLHGPVVEYVTREAGWVHCLGIGGGPHRVTVEQDGRRAVLDDVLCGRCDLEIVLD